MYKKIFNISIGLDYILNDILLTQCNFCDLKFFYPMITGDEDFYDSLQKNYWYYLAHKSEYNFAKKFVRSNHDVLEIGCGYGAFAEMIECKSYTGLEFSPEAIKKANNKGISVYKQNIEDHAENHYSKYDIVCFFQVLEHVYNVRSFIESAIRCLKNNGILIISVPSDDSFIGQSINNLSNMPPHHVTRWTDKCLFNISELFNIKVLEVEHEILKDTDIYYYCKCILINSLCNIFKIKKKVRDWKFNFFPMKFIIKILSLFLAFGLKPEQLRPRGHSVNVAYHKP